LTYNDEYPLAGSIPMNGFIVNDIPYFIDDIGYIYKFTGGGFSVVQQFPMVEEELLFTGTSPVIAENDGIQPHGSTVVGHLVYILVAAPLASRRMRSGIWCFNTVTRDLYHIRGVGQHKTAGTEVDFGCSPLFRPGALKFAIRQANKGDLLVGAGVYKNYTSGTKSVICETVSNRNQASSAGLNRGYFITPQLTIPEAEALWEGLWLKFKRFVSSSNQITVRWRVVDPLRDATGSDESVLQISGTWATTTTFSAVVPTGVAVGHEVEVMAGANAGCTFKISALSATPDGSATITVTISEAAPNDPADAVDDALFNFDNWTTETAITSQTIGNKKVPFTTASKGEFIQFKVELRGYGMEIDELFALYKNNTLIEQH
jgi:hypothetical protein